MLPVYEPLRQRATLAHPVLEECPPADGMRSGEFEVGNGETYEVLGGIFRRTIGTCRPGRFENRIEHRQCARSDTKDEFVEVLEDIVDRSDGAAGLAGEVARPQAREAVCGDDAFGDIDQPLSQRRVTVPLRCDHGFF